MNRQDLVATYIISKLGNEFYYKLDHNNIIEIFYKNEYIGFIPIHLKINGLMSTHTNTKIKEDGVAIFSKRMKEFKDYL